MGKAPAHIDITAMRHTDIVYQSAEELRAEFRKALEAEGVPRALLDLTVEDELEEPSAKAHFCPGERRRAGLSVMQRQIDRTQQRQFAAFRRKAGKSQFAKDCVVGPRGLELRAKHAVCRTSL